jgi:hypothetical protein
MLSKRGARREVQGGVPVQRPRGALRVKVRRRAARAPAAARVGGRRAALLQRGLHAAQRAAGALQRGQRAGALLRIGWALRVGSGACGQRGLHAAQRSASALEPARSSAVSSV